jgi:ribosomal protein S18 acetylase RimI-like enzyme
MTGDTWGVSEIHVRDARAADGPVLDRIFRRASLGNAGDREALLARPDVLRLADDLIGRGRTRVAVVAGDTVVGFASTSRSSADTLELDDLFVDPDWQRHGAARQLIAHIVVEAAADGVVRIDVTANDHALAFYRDAGFEEDGRVRTLFGEGNRMHFDVTERPANAR